MPFLRRRHALALLACLLTAGWSGASRAQDSGVTRATLPNGLRVIIVENKLAPVVTTSVNYLVGSDEAPDGFPGMAHAQEHMMFRGAPGLSSDQLADMGSLMGGNFNADTRESVTQFLFTVPAEYLDTALHVESIRMRGVNDTEPDWDQERGAIEQEVAQDLSNPGYVLSSKLRAAFFAGTTYEHDALGTRPSFDKTTAAMLRQFHDSWYAPNNAILVVVGNLDPDKTLGEIRTLFGDIPSKTLPARPGFALKPARYAPITMHTDQPEGTELVAVRIPGTDDPDFPALEVLSDVLSSQRGELYALVPAGKVLDAGFALNPLRQAGMAYAAASFDPESDPKAVDGEIRAVLSDIARNGVPPDLVDAAKLGEKSEAEFEKNSIEGLASSWSDAVAVYGMNSPDDDLARIEKVSVADVDRVARKYLVLDRAISATMLPQGSGAAVSSAAGFGGQENIALGEAKPTPLPDWAQAAFAHLAAPPPTPAPTVSTLPNGLTLIVQPEDVSDTVSVYGHIENRAATEEPAGQEGVASLLDHLFSFGSQSLDRIAFQQALDRLGAGESAGTDFELQVLTQNFDKGVALFADNELHPALPEPAMKVLQEQLAEETGARDRSPGYVGQRSLTAALFPASDPSLREATPQTIRALTLDQVKTFYRQTFRPDLATIVVIGRITPDQARATIEKYFGGWQGSGPKPKVDLPAVPDNRRDQIAVPDQSRVQDTVALAQTLAMTRSDPDYYALRLGSAVLGGGFYSSRLSIDLRKNAGLVYTVGTSIEAGRTRSVYFIQFASDPGNVSKSAGIIGREIKAMQDQPASADEVARAKAMLVGQIPLSEASVGQIALGMINRRDLGLPLDESDIAARKIIALDPADIQAAFRKWLRPDDLVQVSRGPNPG